MMTHAKELEKNADRIDAIIAYETQRNGLTLDEIATLAEAEGIFRRLARREKADSMVAFQPTLFS